MRARSLIPFSMHCFMLCTLACVLFFPQASLAADAPLGVDTPMGTVIYTVSGWLTGNLGRGLATVGIIIIGILAMFGRIDWKLALLAGVGVAIIFGAPSLTLQLEDAVLGKSNNNIVDTPTPTSTNGDSCITPVSCNCGTTTDANGCAICAACETITPPNCTDLCAPYDSASNSCQPKCPGQACDSSTGNCTAIDCDYLNSCKQLDSASQQCQYACNDQQTCTAGQGCVDPTCGICEKLEDHKCVPKCGAGTNCDGSGSCISICDQTSCQTWDVPSSSCINSCVGDQTCQSNSQSISNSYSCVDPVCDSSSCLELNGQHKCVNRCTGNQQCDKNGMGTCECNLSCSFGQPNSSCTACECEPNQGIADCNGNQICAPRCENNSHYDCNTGSCVSNYQCRNGSCEPGEDCSTCPEDCGSCGPVCGNGTCESGAGEDYNSCPSDCPAPPPFCGDQVCSGDESCDTCAQDCGSCNL